MSLLILPNPGSAPVDSTDWTKFIAREDVSNIGNGLSIRTFSLTNWSSSTTVPAIAAGSMIEVGGSIYQADSDTALTEESGIADGIVHIKLVPDSATDPTQVTPYLTNDAIPAWDAVKGGWYDSDDKFLPFEMTRSSAVFTNKFEYIEQNKLVKQYATGGFYYPGAGEIGGALSVGGTLAVSGETSLNSVLNPTTTPVADEISFSSVGTYIMPRGIYFFSIPPAGRENFLQVRTNGVWRDIRGIQPNSTDSAGGVLFSDGSNLRIDCRTVLTNNVVRWLQF